MSDIGALIDYSPTNINTVSSNAVWDSLASFGANAFSGSSTWGSANLAIFIPIRIGYQYIVDRMWWVNGVTVGTNNVSIGVYDTQGNQLVVSSATLTSGASSIQSVSVTATTLEAPGIYYMAMAVNGTTDTFFQATPVAQGLRGMGILSMVSAYPLPTPATMIGTTTAKLPLVGMTNKTLV